MSQQNPEQQESVPFSSVQPQSGVTVITKPRKLNMYSVTEDELESLYTSGNYKTLDVALFSLTFGIFVTLLITLSTVEIKDARIYASFSSATFLFLIFSVFFAIRSIIAWLSSKRRLDEIKREEIQ